MGGYVLLCVAMCCYVLLCVAMGGYGWLCVFFIYVKYAFIVINNEVIKY